jgi:predicted RNA-binding Zn-ribbon protein involved in translation (DUF1610 family)
VRVFAWCHDCDARLDESPGAFACPECKKEYPVLWTEGLRAEGRVDKCALCGYERFHVRKDFPRRLGLAIVLVAAALCFAPIFPPGFFFMPLIIASAIDLLLYQFIPWKTVCYVCDTEYRGMKPDPAIAPYDLATATECKRLRWPRPSGSAEQAA